MLDCQPASRLEKSCTSHEHSHPWLTVSDDFECPAGTQAQFHACRGKSGHSSTHTMANHRDLLRSVCSGGLLDSRKNFGLGTANGSIDDYKISSGWTNLQIIHVMKTAVNLCITGKSREYRRVGGLEEKVGIGDEWDDLEWIGSLVHHNNG